MEMGAQQEKAFAAVKSQLISDCLLVHFDPQKSLTLACDAFPMVWVLCYLTT